MLALAMLVLPLLAPSPGEGEPARADEKVVKDAGFEADKAGLLDFFRKRSLTDTERKDCEVLIRRLGSNEFEQRRQASIDLTRRGSVVIPLLRDALHDPDAEIVRRARDCLDAIDAADPAVPVAAARLLFRRAPDEAVPALLTYLPYAAGEQETEELLALFVEMCPAPDKIHPGLSEALRDPLPSRRAVAAYVLGRKGTANDCAAVHKLLVDKDTLVRFRAAQGLLGVQDKAAVPALLTLLDEAPVSLAFQAEDALYTLAGERSPSIPGFGAGSDAAERRRCRDAWAAWWKENESTVDLKRYAEGERVLGLTLGIEYNTGRVWECGRDKGVRWEIKGLQGPMEAQVLPNGLVLIAESNNHLVTVRDLKGNVKWEKKIDGEPTGCQRLPSGNTFVSTYNSVLELNAKGETVYAFELNGGSNAIRKARNGHIIYAKGAEIIEVDTTGKRVRAIPLRQPGCVGIQDLPGDRFLVTMSKQGQVIEVDANGKVRWETQVTGACGVARLPNGHTLVAADKHVVELDEQGKPVWDKDAEGYVRRVHRR